MTKTLGKRAMYARRRQEMARLYLNEGLTLRGIAAVMGITYQSVYVALKMEGVPMRPRGGYTGRTRRR